MESVRRLNDLGADYAEKGQYDHAIGAFTRVIEIDANFGEAFYNRGCIYAKKGQNALAIADYDRAIELDKNNFDALHNRGVAKQKSGDVSGGNQDIERARQLRRSKGWRNPVPIPQKGSERYEFMIRHPFLYVWQENGFLKAVYGQVGFWILAGIAVLFIWIAFNLVSRWGS
jgi:tetratricopeptide (TPR) repeat protein